MKIALMMGLLLSTAMTAGWERLPELPAPISGQMAGVRHGALLVLGGSNFPVPYFEGGAKTWVDTVYVLEPNAHQWKTARLPRPSAYGAGVTTPDGVIVIGGGNAEKNFCEVGRYTWTAGQLHHESWPSLPVPLANLAAAQSGSHIYVVGGQESPAATPASRRLLRLDMKALAKGWQVLVEVRAAGLIFPVFAASGDSLYLFSGAWRYLPGKGWQAIANPPRPMVAATAVLAHGCVYAIGGDDGEFAFHIWELKDKHPGFHEDILKFDPKTGAWPEAGNAPVSLVTTTPVILSGKLVIAGSEDRPGHRSAAVYSFLIEALK